MVAAGYAGAVSGTIYFAEKLLGRKTSLATILATFALSDALLAGSWQDFVWRSAVNVASTVLAPYDSPMAMVSRILLSQFWLLKETVPDIWLGFQPRYEGEVPIRFMNPFIHQMFRMYYATPDNEYRWQQDAPGLDIIFEDNKVIGYMMAAPMEQQLVQLHSAGLKAGVEKIQLLPLSTDSIALEANLTFSDGSLKQVMLPIVFSGNRKAYWWAVALAGKKLRKLAGRETLLSPINQCSLQQLISVVNDDEIEPCRLNLSEQHVGDWQNLAVISAGKNGYWLFDYYPSQGYELPEIWLNTGQGLGRQYSQQVNKLEWMRGPAATRGFTRLAQESTRSLVYQGISTLFIRYLEYLRQSVEDERQGRPPGSLQASTEEGFTMSSRTAVHLSHFVDAQNSSGQYERALGELRNGRKVSHWIWYIFPQLEGLGVSRSSHFYGIRNIQQAKDYLNDPILGSRLRECSQALLNVENRSILDIMGTSLDATKLYSSMTFFEAAADDSVVFSGVLEKYFSGLRDQNILDMINRR
ncbi:DUF1810 domain-containing protein [Sansalvadorimonas sp. 2012CJ34-2]|uniref:DUF1810 domain-containing protein n=1 Tax=Parendozoicomonas callyspongiae TaxID=2942213 RepID=A0ABT0PH32_9GAMM|nr:DUF1810 domain-containing protein [Sansalvadorimonas sp. 2012CJ34-2]MCL6270694.1 DUF1810 domain-containing protein [Sansalvadorimonas sp. 2012CJ34-2]